MKEIELIISEIRESAGTKFTSSPLRYVAREIGFLIDKAANPEKYKNK